jgi:hypothetical protein
MKENVILVNYSVESEAYQALSELKRAAANANYTISQAAVVKVDENVVIEDVQKAWGPAIDPA